MRKQLEGKYLPKVNYHFFQVHLNSAIGGKSTLKQVQNFYFLLLILSLEMFFLHPFLF